MDDRRVIKVSTGTLANLNTMKHALMLSTLEETIERLIQAYNDRGEKDE